MGKFRNECDQPAFDQLRIDRFYIYWTVTASCKQFVGAETQTHEQRQESQHTNNLMHPLRIKLSDRFIYFLFKDHKFVSFQSLLICFQSLLVQELNLVNSIKMIVP